MDDFVEELESRRTEEALKTLKRENWIEWKRMKIILTVLNKMTEINSYHLPYFNSIPICKI